MKFSVSTLALYPNPLEDILDFLSANKIRYCEIINEYPYHHLDSDIIDSYDVKYSLHAPLSDINLASHNHVIRLSSIEQMKNTMRIASDNDIDVVVVHPGHMPILQRGLEEKVMKYNLESLAECSKYAQDSGINMAIENMPDIDGLLFKDLTELDDLVNEINAYITLDVGHAHNMQFSIPEMLRSSRIKHVHLSDNDGNYDDHAALGSGSLDFKKLFHELDKNNYTDILVVEVKDYMALCESLRFLNEVS